MSTQVPALRSFSQTFADVYVLNGLRTPMVDYCGAFAQLSPTVLGIKAARAVIAASGLSASMVDSVLCGNMAPGDFDQFFLPRHIGLYAGVDVQVPALMVQRICGTGLELFRQAAEQTQCGLAQAALVVGTESMSRNPIASFVHRSGFTLGSPVQFKDYMWEALHDSAPNVSMIQTAETLAHRYGISRSDVDAFASLSFARAVAAQASGFLAGEIVPVHNETFAAESYQARHLQLPKKISSVTQDTHPRLSPPEVLAQLRPVYPGGVQTGGNSSALVDGAAAALVCPGEFVRGQGLKLLARVVAAAVVGVPPEVMGIGPAPAIRAVLARAELPLSAMDLFEVNEAQGAQTLAVARELGLDLDTLNVHGGAIALGHPLAMSGVRLVVTLARSLQLRGLRYGIASACIGGGQGMAVLIENPDALD